MTSSLGVIENGLILVHVSSFYVPIVQGAILSGARRVPFAHNDLGELERVAKQIERYQAR